MITLNVHGINIEVYTSDAGLIDFIKKYYEIFLVTKLSWKRDIIIEIEKYSYFTSRKNIHLDENFTVIGDNIRIDVPRKRYFFENNEIQVLADFSSETIRIKATFQPLLVRHWLNILLQWYGRIQKYYNRFIIKTVLHDSIFLLLERRNGIHILHATAVTDGKRTLIFTGLGWSGKSTLASAFLTKKWFTILSDNYCIVKEDRIYPFPELPRITSETAEILNITQGNKADGIKNYLNNPVKDIQKSYFIDSVFLCSYSKKDFKIQPLNDHNMLYENIVAINHYTKEFPEYLNFALISFLEEYGGARAREEHLQKFIKMNSFYFLENTKDITSNLDIILQHV